MLEFPKIFLKLNNNLECLGLKKTKKQTKQMNKTPTNTKQTKIKGWFSIIVCNHHKLLKNILGLLTY